MGEGGENRGGGKFVITYWFAKISIQVDKIGYKSYNDRK